MSRAKRVHPILRSVGWIATLVVALATVATADDNIVWLFETGLVQDFDWNMTPEEICAAAHDEAMAGLEDQCELRGGQLLYETCSTTEEDYHPPDFDNIWPMCIVEIGCLCRIQELE